MLPPVGSRCQTRHDARGVMAKLRKVNSRNCTIAYDDAASFTAIVQKVQAALA